MADDPIWDQYERGWTKTDDRKPAEKKASEVEGPSPFTVVGDDEPELVLQEATLPEPSEIPPRPWLYGTHLLREYVSILVAPGGVGKTSLAMGIGLALVTGRPFFGDKIYEPVNVAVLNLEDPMDELNRRLAALMMCHNVSRSEVEGKLFMYSGDSRRVTIAKVSDDGFDIVYPDVAAIIREIQAHKIGLLIVDPCAESHELDENSNREMNRAVAAWRRITRVTGCSILLVHHVRKGKGIGGADIDSARGAKSLTDAARVGLLLTAMTEEEAEEFDIPPEERTSYVRLDDAKANMAPRAGAARWFNLKTVELGNATAKYPNGDRVAAITRWYPPSAMGNLTDTQCNEALDKIDAGPSEGVRYTARNTGGTDRWAGTVLIELFGVSERRAGTVLRAWLREGLLEEREYKDPKQRRNGVKGLFVSATKLRPGTLL